MQSAQQGSRRSPRPPLSPGDNSRLPSLWCLKSGLSSREDRCPSIDGFAVKQGFLRTGPSSRLLEDQKSTRTCPPALTPSDSQAGRIPKHPLPAGSWTPWPCPGRREGGGFLDLPTSAACEVGLPPTFLVGHPGPAWVAGSLHFRTQEGTIGQNASLILVMGFCGFL